MEVGAEAGTEAAGDEVVRDAACGSSVVEEAMSSSRDVAASSLGSEKECQSRRGYPRLPDGGGLSSYLLMRVVRLCMLLDAMAAPVLGARIQLGTGARVAGREAMRPGDVLSISQGAMRWPLCAVVLCSEF